MLIEAIQNMYESILRSIASVLKAEGASTSYS
jgi:hypothetical protein